MKITAEQKKAFRLAYDALEAAEDPVNTPEYFTAEAEKLTRLNPEDPLAERLLSAVYGYLADIAQKK